VQTDANIPAPSAFVRIDRNPAHVGRRRVSYGAIQLEVIICKGGDLAKRPQGVFRRHEDVNATSAFIAKREFTVIVCCNCFADGRVSVPVATLAARVSSSYPRALQDCR
jgi:hypothetical protein